MGARRKVRGEFSCLFMVGDEGIDYDYDYYCEGDKGLSRSDQLKSS